MRTSVRMSSVMAALLLGCAPGGSVIQAQSAGDLFPEALHALHALADDLELRIDPRPLITDPDVYSPFSAELVQLPGPELRRREAEMRRLNLRQISMLDRTECGMGGTPPPPPPPPAPPPPPRPPMRQYVCAIVSLPRMGGVHFPRENIDERVAGESVRSVRAILIGPGTHTVADLVFTPAASGGWELKERRVLLKVMS